MATFTANMTDSLTLADKIEVDTRFSFTARYLCASAMFARRCAAIEEANPSNPDDPTRTEHIGLVTATIMQCAAAVEAESAELTMHGPGHHLGSDHLDATARDFLRPLSEFIDDQQALARYRLILHLLNKPPLAEGQQPWQDMATLVRLRNELVHYKSKWGKDMDRERLFTSLRQLRLSKPTFISANSNFFPHQLLSAACAAWSVRTAVAFLKDFYDHIGVESPLAAYMAQFNGL